MGNVFKSLHRCGILPVLACLPVCVSNALAQSHEAPPGTEEIPAASEPVSAALVDGELYEDEYLLEGDDLPGLTFESGYEEPLGRRFFSTDLVVYRNDNNVFGGQSEQGLRSRWGRETLRFGTLEADVVVSDITHSFPVDRGSSTEAMVTLRQRGAPVADDWLMSNTLGYQRSLSGTHVGGGYRVRLPSSPLMGIAGEIGDANRTAHWFTGRTGRINGIALTQFENDGGNVTGGGYRQSFSPWFSVFGQVVNFSGNQQRPGHTSMLTAASLANEDRSRQYDFSLLVDDSANIGLWADTEHLLNDKILFRYGAYYLDPNLAWMDKPIASDEYGGYFRADRQSSTLSLSAGYDYSRTGLNLQDGSRSDVHNLYFNGNFRLTRRLNIGTAGTIVSRSLTSSVDDSQFAWRLSNFLFYRSLLGTSRFEFFLRRSDSDFVDRRRDTTGLLLSHQWRMPQSLRLTTEFRTQDTQSGLMNSREVEASAIIRHDLHESFSWGFNAGLYRRSSDQLGTNNGVALNADVRWAFLPNWYTTLIVTRNSARLDDPASLPGEAVEHHTTGNTFWLTLGYGRSGGQPIRILGEGSGGAGRIEGEVFYDENGDFVRQPGEQPVVGAVVLMDGRYEARTDAAGRYSFEPVYSGLHRVSLVVSELPLPWGLHDEAPRMVNVSTRHPGQANFGLVRLD